MKKMITMVAALIVAVTLNASNKNIENSVSEFIRVAPFAQVNINVPGRVRVIQGEEYGVMMTSSWTGDSAALNCQVKDGVLYIYSDNNEILSDNGRGTTITVLTPANDAVLKTGNSLIQVANRKK